jgi:hypothetical protein
MQELLAKLMGSQEGLIVAVVMIMIGVNIALTSARKFLGWLHLKTESKVDDKAYVVVSRILGWSDKALQFMSANSAMLPAKAKAEIDRNEWKLGPALENIGQEEKKPE